MVSIDGPPNINFVHARVYFSPNAIKRHPIDAIINNMCGRFTLTLSIADLKDYIAKQYDIFDIDESLYAPRYNIAPTQPVLAIIHDGISYRIGNLKWGIIPENRSDEKSGYALINAKAETIQNKPSFRSSFEKRRCLILADGYYEWQKTDEGKIPYRFTLKDKSPFALAGIWASHTTKDGKKIYTCAIITTKGNKIMEGVHDRMPVIIPKKDQQTWLKKEIHDFKPLKELLIPFNSENMTRYPVSKSVNNPFIDQPHLVDPL